MTVTLCFKLVCCAWVATAGYIRLKVANHGMQARRLHLGLQALNLLTLSSFMAGIFIRSQVGVGYKIIGTALLVADIAFGYLEQKLWRRATEH